MKILIGLLIYFVVSIIFGLILGREFKKAREAEERYLSNRDEKSD